VIANRRNRRRGPARRGARGFTLIELLIAAALLAVLAVLSWRGLDAVLASRTRIVAASDELRAMTLAFAQIDEDLRRSWPVRLLRLPVPSIGFSVTGEQSVVTLELLREAGTSAQPTQVQRVAWRLRDGLLERGFAPWVVPSGDRGAQLASAGGDAVGLIWQPVLTGVASIGMQGWIAGQGWVAAEALAGQLAGAAQEATAESGAGTGQGGTVTPPGTGRQPVVVTGLLLRVVRTDGHVLQRIFPVKD
jgi:general secretion pathway protein J